MIWRQKLLYQYSCLFFFFYLKEVKSCHVHTVSVDLRTGSSKYTQVLQKMFSFEGLKGFENLKQDVYNVVRL